jgi:hypothetical protein
MHDEDNREIQCRELGKRRQWRLLKAPGSVVQMTVTAGERAWLKLSRGAELDAAALNLVRVGVHGAAMVVGMVETSALE